MRRLGVPSTGIRVAACLSGNDHVVGVSRYGMLRSLKLTQRALAENETSGFVDLLDKVLSMLSCKQIPSAIQCREQAIAIHLLFQDAPTATPLPVQATPIDLSLSPLDRFLHEVDENGNKRRPKLAERKNGIGAQMTGNDEQQSPQKFTAKEWTLIQKKKRRGRRQERQRLAENAMEKSFVVHYNVFDLLSTEDHELPRIESLSDFGTGDTLFNMDLSRSGTVY